MDVNQQIDAFFVEDHARRSDTSEVFKPVPGYRNYQISNRGGLVSFFGGSEKILSPTIGSTGYPKVSLVRGKEKRTFNIHTLVMISHVGPRPEGMVVRHLDGNPENNKLSNLKYGTFCENEADKARHGRRPVGEAVFGSKLSESDVLLIRKEFARGVTAADIAVRFCLHITTAHHVIHGKTWGHLPIPDYSSREVKYVDGHPNRGERSALAKLTERTARLAVQMLLDGKSTSEIGGRLGVSRQAISHIAGRRTWKHLTKDVTWRLA